MPEQYPAYFTNSSFKIFVNSLFARQHNIRCYVVGDTGSVLEIKAEGKSKLKESDFRNKRAEFSITSGQKS